MLLNQASFGYMVDGLAIQSRSDRQAWVNSLNQNPRQKLSGFLPSTSVGVQLEWGEPLRWHKFFGHSFRFVVSGSATLLTLWMEGELGEFAETSTAARGPAR